MAVDSVIYEECFFNGRETEWKGEGSTDEGEVALLKGSCSESLSCKDQQQGVAMQGGDRDKVLGQGGDRVWVSDGDLSSSDPGVAETVSPGQENQGSLEASLFVPESPLGLEASDESAFARKAGSEKDLGKLPSFSVLP
ncbi:hypothetical protein QQ045_019977 [Rhodiola kirilowii]